jgi:hypothetical protein
MPGPVNPYPSGPDADIKALLNGSSAASLQGRATLDFQESNRQTFSRNQMAHVSNAI